MRTGYHMVALLLIQWPAHAAAAHTFETVELPRPDGARSVIFAAPAAQPPALRPFVILLHGHGGSAAQLLGRRQGAAPLSRWLDIADRDGVLLAAPDGAQGSDGKQGWNDCRADADSNPRTDDVALVRDIIERAVGEYRADPARIYVMGMSNGAMMTFRVATELPGKLAAVAAVSGSMAAHSQCVAPGQPVSLLVIAGDADPLVPFGGGEVRLFSSRSRGTVLGVEKAVEFWRALAQLPVRPAVVTTFPHEAQSGDTSARRTKWGADPKALQVELVVIHNGGHVEPSPTRRIGGFHGGVVGGQNADFEAADEAWAFFRDKTRAH
jgi:polyhydroxybutyrate depolymerase